MKGGRNRIIFSYLLLASAAVLFAVSLVVVRGWNAGTPAVPAEAESSTGAWVAAATGAESGPVSETRAAGRPEVQPGARVAIVIDDVGNNMEELEPFLALPMPLTFAVMPVRTFSEESVARIRSAGKSYIMHQPMEPVGDANPGPGAIFNDMSREEIWSTLDQNLASLGGAAGLNNHMGSLVTADKRTMGYILDYIEEKKMFFLDSLTTGESVAAELSLERNVPYMKRNSMFLDNNRESEYIERALRSGFKLAGQSGRAVMIGHVWDEHLARLLLDLYPEFNEAGYSFDDIGNMILLGQEQDEE